MSFIADLGRWMSGQRWFQADTAAETISIVGSWEVSASPRVEIALVDSAGVLYVVPLLHSDVPLDHEPISRDGYVYDATDLPEGQLALLNLCDQEVTGTGICMKLEGTGRADKVASSARLTGEQSNTSIRYQMADGSQVILKVFRILTAGENPDVILTGELAAEGFDHVARPVGSVTASWSGGGLVATGHILVAAEFMSGATDAWQVLTEAAQRGPLTDEDADRIADLGVVVRDMHEVLAARLGTEGAAARKHTMIDAWRRRAAKAIADAPVLSEYAAQIDSVYDSLADSPWPRLQRIHGDLHLGQVLDVPHRGWILLDFEGEPLRPLSERVQNDLAERDVAGMLRSFDYVAGDAISKGVDPAQAKEWAAKARTAFLDGYGHIDHGDLLDGLELDKALYEVSYETNQRPAWVDVPLAGVRSLLAPTPSPTEVTAMPSITVPTQTLAAVAEGRYHAPHDILGPHEFDGGVAIRVVRHLAEKVFIVLESGEVEATHEYGGVWYAEIPGSTVPDYRVRAVYSASAENTTDDPYRFLPTIGEVDTYLFGEGRHEELWKVLGAHLHTYDSVLGTVHGASFSVWAPNATAVRVVGDFNQWNGVGHAMRSVGSSGVWEIFVPGACDGQRYKFEIQYRDGSWHQKADPMARRTEIPPSTASIITESTYTWSDDVWMSQRAESNPLEGPISVYEVHLGSWRQGLSFKEMADQLIGHVTYLGFTHVEFMPISEHPFGGSWGYQVSGYYAPTARFGDPDEFRYLIDKLHEAGIGVIVDWVPAHFPKDSWALAQFDGTALYEDPDPLRGEHPDWGTLIFNYGRREVRNFLVANALYWLEEFHIDGIRVDAVASMLYLDYSREAGQWRPNVYGGRENLEAISFLQETNATAYRRNPGILMIAEESTSWPGVTAMTDQNGLGFGLKWNMGWMNDTLHYMSEEPINRRYHHGEITFSLVYAFSEQYLLPLSHDEVVHGKGSLYRKMPGDHWQKLAGVRLLYAYQWAHPGKQLIFMGQEFAQIEEWNEGKGLDWWLTDSTDHDQVMALVARLNEVYKERPALHSDDFTNHGFEWIEVSDGDHNVLSFLRKSADDSDMVAAVINFAGTPHENYRVGVPHGGTWEEILNSDALEYGGSGVGNFGAVEAEPIPWNGRPFSLNLRVPPLGAVYFAPKK